MSEKIKKWLKAIAVIDYTEMLAKIRRDERSVDECSKKREELLKSRPDESGIADWKEWKTQRGEDAEW